MYLRFQNIDPVPRRIGESSPAWLARCLPPRYPTHWHEKQQRVLPVYDLEKTICRLHNSATPSYPDLQVGPLEQVECLSARYIVYYQSPPTFVSMPHDKMGWVAHNLCFYLWHHIGMNHLASHHLPVMKLWVYTGSHTPVSGTQNWNRFSVGATLSFVRHMEGQKCSYITQDHILFSLLFYLSRLFVIRVSHC